MHSVKIRYFFMSRLGFALGITMATLVGAKAIAAVELAKVNGKVISDHDVKVALTSLNEAQRSAVLKDTSAKRQIVASLIDQEILVSQAEKEKLDRDAEFKSMLDAFRKQLLANRVVQKNLAGKLTDKAAKDYYERNKSRFTTDEAQVQHILLKDEAKAKEVLAMAQKPDADFQKLAETYSQDPSVKTNKGDLGTIGLDSPFVQSFKDAALKGAEGTVTGPVKTEYGYHLIKVVKKKAGRLLKYEEVEMKVKDALRGEILQDYLIGLKRQAKIIVNDKGFSQF